MLIGSIISRKGYALAGTIGKQTIHDASIKRHQTFFVVGTRDSGGVICIEMRINPRFEARNKDNTQ